MTTPILRSPTGTFVQPYGQHPANGIARVTQPFHLTAMVVDGVTVKRHDGIDINFGPGIVGHPLYAMGAGTVQIAAALHDPVSAGAIVVQIKHAGYLTLEGHLRREIVSVGQKLAAGAPIGELGATGRVSGPHVHAELWIGGQPVDPWPYFAQNQPKTCHPKRLDGSRIHTAAATDSPIFASTRLADQTIRTAAGVALPGSIGTPRPYGGTVPGGKWRLPDGQTGYGWVRIKFGTTWYFIADALADVT